MKKWFLLLSAGVVGLAASAQTTARKIAFEKYTLPNGLKVILHQDKSAPVVAVTTLYHVGCFNDA